MITEGSDGSIFEVTHECEIVWEYISPYFGDDKKANYVYRAYRVPYGWIPQLEKPKEKSVPPLDNSRFRVPGSEWKKEDRVTKVEGVRGFNPDPQLCVVTLDE